MPLRKEAERYARVGVKDCWHPYGLQGLSPEKFAMVASQILNGEFGLLMLNPRKVVNQDSACKIQLIYLNTEMVK
jgi:hypothetical protein